MLAHLLGGGQTSLLYRTLVLEEKKAVGAGAYYMGSALDDTRFYLYAMPTPGSHAARARRGGRRGAGEFIAEGVDAEALERAKTRLVADAIYAQDSQATLARWYGASLATGQTIRDVQEWPARIEAVTAEAVLAAARKWLVPTPRRDRLSAAGRGRSGLRAAAELSRKTCRFGSGAREETP